MDRRRRLQVGCEAPGHRVRRTRCSVLCGEPGAVELLVQLEGRRSRQFSRSPGQLQLVSIRSGIGPVPEMPNSGSRIILEKNRVQQLTPYAVIFPYIRMGRSITAFSVDRTQGQFGPFEDQMFLGDYTQSIIMRATTEKVEGSGRARVIRFVRDFPPASSMSNSHPVASCCAAVPIAAGR